MSEKKEKVKIKGCEKSMGEKIGTFLNNYGGFILGIIIGAIVVALGIIDVIIKIAIVIGFGFVGTYIQKNKSKVKESLKNQIDKW